MSALEQEIEERQDRYPSQEFAVERVLLYGCWTFLLPRRAFICAPAERRLALKRVPVLKHAALFRVVPQEKQRPVQH